MLSLTIQVQVSVGSNAITLIPVLCKPRSFCFEALPLRPVRLLGKRFVTTFGVYFMTKKLLGLEDFLQLTESKQFDLLHKDGVHVGKRKVAEQTVILFQLYGFYVEVFYKQYRKLVDRIVTSKSTYILQPYLDQVHVRDLRKGKNED